MRTADKFCNILTHNDVTSIGRQKNSPRLFAHGTISSVTVHRGGPGDRHFADEPAGSIPRAGASDSRHGQLALATCFRQLM